MNGETTFTIALISEVFHQDDGETRLRERLTDAKERGAALAILPEIPLNPWSPATTTTRDDDAEPPNGPRFQIQQRAATDVGIALVGGAIVNDPETETRHNTGFVFSATGKLLGQHRKSHIPEEPGFQETSHYEAGDDPPRVVNGLPMPIGVQICSDINRPEGCHLLGAMGAELIVAPRASEEATYWKWRPVFQANAVTSCCYVASVNRPAPEQGVGLGGPSIVVAPNSEIIVQTTETVAIADLSHHAIQQARRAYPGYLPVRGELYARAWREIASINETVVQ